MNVPYEGRVLKLGSTGNPVYAIKRALVKAGFARHTRPNLLYGLWTMNAVAKLQRARGLTVDGEVGKLTLAALSEFFDDYGYKLYTGHAPPDSEALQLPSHFTPTHETSGLPGFPAIDLFAPAGTQVLAPEDGQLDWPHMIEWDKSRAVGGMTCYWQGARNTYFLTHFGMLNPRGRYAKGDVIGTVARVPNDWWPSHIHEGLHQGRYLPTPD